ncbi:uncharacterized protein [Branchiostoma lanceolatum]|uniref:uncharacterized protein n=1 Tax=Branchiostoma lanceolatum TaxID=7740 RepID=UPI003455F4D1
MPVTYLVKKPVFLYKPRPRRRRQNDEIKRRKLPDCRVINKVTSQGNHNTIINKGHNVTVHMVVKVNINVERPLQPTTRLHIKKQQKPYRKLLDRLDQLSATGELKKCEEIINRLFEHTSDPDDCAMLWIAAAACCINGGEMMIAREALRQVTDLLPQTENSDEHELARDYYQSLIDLREDRYDCSIRVITMALCKIQMKQVGHMRAWLLINLGWCYTKMAQLEQVPYKQAELIKDAKEPFARAIDASCHEDEEFPGQLTDKKTRIRQCALIGRVYLRLRCWHSVLVDGNNTNPGIMDEISQEDIKEAEQILRSLENREPVCGICEVLYHLAKANLSYRFKQYPEALKEAEAAKDLAILKNFNNYIDIADSTVKLFKEAVI